MAAHPATDTDHVCPPRGAPPRPVHPHLAACLSGDIPPEVALARMLAGSGDVDAVARAVRDLAANLAPHAEQERLAALRALLPQLERACRPIGALLARQMSASDESDTDLAIAQNREFFDQAVAASEEASVALYSLGSAELLERASNEIVRLLGAWGAIGPHRSVLQIGCGIGRMESALAPLVRSAHGIDISPSMIAAARRRCRGLANVEFDVCTGRDLGSFADASLHLVYAVDSFPYLVQCGWPLVERHFIEAHRVLRPGGDLAIFNFSYRGDADADRRDVARLAGAAGLDLLVGGTRPFTHWDGLAFHLRRPA